MEFDIEDHPEAYDEEKLTKCLTRVRGWLRKGYRDAQKRFHGASQWSLSNLFANIEREAQEAIEQAGGEMHYILEIRYDTKTLEHSVRLREEWEQ